MRRSMSGRCFGTMRTWPLPGRCAESRCFRIKIKQGTPCGHFSVRPQRPEHNVSIFWARILWRCVVVLETWRLDRKLHLQGAQFGWLSCICAVGEPGHDSGHAEPTDRTKRMADSLIVDEQ